MQKENIILVDFKLTDNDWKFKKNIEKTTKLSWSIKQVVSNQARKGLITKLRYIF